MAKTLLTGFAPFGGDATNPSGDAVRLVGAREDGSDELVTAILPVTFGGAADRLRELIAQHEPEVVIAVGLAGGRAAVTPERVAINLADARIPDNAGAQPMDQPVAADGPAAYFSTLPVKAMVAAIAEAGLPAALSHSAGTFVCNHVMYAALHATAGTGVRAGFVHVPYAAESAPAGAPAMPLHDIARALEIAVRTARDTRVDARISAGTLH